MKKTLLFLVLIFISSTNNFAQNSWSAVGEGLNGSVRSLTRGLPGELFAGGDFTDSDSTFVGKVAMLAGGTWIGTDTMDNFNSSVHVLHYTSNYLYAGGHFTQRIRRYNISNLWTNLGSVQLNDDVDAITSIGSSVYAAGSFSHAGNTPLHYVGMWNGSNWSPLDTGLNGTALALASIGSNLYVGGIFYKTYAGMDLKRIAMWNGHWNQLGDGIPNGEVLSLAVIGNDLYVAGTFTLSASNGSAKNIAKWNGTQWQALGSGTDGSILCMTVSGNTLYVGGIFNNAGGNPAKNVAKWDGANWSSLGSGTNAMVRSLCVADDYLYAGGDFTTAGTVTAKHVAKWGLPIGINQISTEVPPGYSLSQNYPNPFNPSTRFKLDIPESAKITIIVYDISGKKVDELVNQNMSAGSYEVDWNASRFSSGTYFCRLQAGSFVETRKLILVK